MPRATPNPPPSHAKPRLKIVRPDFAALRAKRDAAILAIVDAVHAKHFPDKPRAEMQFHCSDMSGCYCACPDGPCEHQFEGWREGPGDGGGWVGENVCKLCGMGAMAHSIRCGP